LRSPATSGLSLAGHKEISTRGPIRSLAPPAEAVLPLNQHTGEPALPTVEVGDRVRIGQTIAAAEPGISACLHAPIAGVVSAIEPRPAPHTGGAAARSIVIENDGSDARADPVIDPQRLPSLSREELVAAIHRAGIVGLGGAAFPTAPKLSGEVRHLLLNGAECEPYISCDQALLVARSEEVVLGAQVMMRALNANRCAIAVESDQAAVIAALASALARNGDERMVLKRVRPLYPMGAERQLITAVTGLEVPAGGLPRDLGIVCQNVGTAAAVARLALRGEPLMSRIVTVTGHGVRDPGNVEALLGSPFAALIERCGGYAQDVSQLIMGGSMMGIALPHDDVPIVKATNCIVAAGPPDLTERGPAMPCIRCGDCAVVCPAGLLPQTLHRYALDDDLDALERYGLDDCIECGCCDYVCPSRIALASAFHTGRNRLRERTDATIRAQRAKELYEARARRLAAADDTRRRQLADKRRRLRESGPR
jgi:H+/Na+-translocating ferredoxin:NAD+ oxidoreductase subunit C